MSETKVSFYIPCFNSASTIGECLDAVFKQVLRPKEVLVIDDGSRDETVKIARRYPVKILRHKKNKGLAAARNTAIRHAKGELIASVDADCLPRPGWLMELVKRCGSKDIGAAGGRLVERYSSEVSDKWRSAHMKQEWGKRSICPPFLFGSNTVFRKVALLESGLYNERFKSNYEDVDISLRLRKKGWRLSYEPKAIAAHWKKDDISTILNTYWRWNAAYYQKKGFYVNTRSFITKIKDNLGLANRYLEEDLRSKRQDLLYLDFLLAIHHSLKDLEYFIYGNDRSHSEYAPLSLWLAFIDLNFFYHFDSHKNRLSTLLSKKDAFIQDFFALNFILSKCIWGRFNDYGVKKNLYGHLLLSVYGLKDPLLLDRLLAVVESRQNWDVFFKKKHANLNALFLKSLYLCLERWLRSLIYTFPRIIPMIEAAAKKTEKTNPCNGERR